MKEQLSVSLIQPDLVWENMEANLESLGRMVERVPRGTELILLPETFSTGFTMQVEKYADGMDGAAVEWMKRVAEERDAVIAGSLIIMEEGNIFNRLLWVTPQGVEDWYDKRHLFRLGREDAHFIRGSRRAIFRLGPFRFLPQICYDLRFPVFSRNRDDYDVMIYAANWPAPRQPVWDSLTRARAIENQAYLLGINRVGVDGEGIGHLGGTCVFDPKGNILEKLGTSEGILQVTLELSQVREFREKFPVWKDADPFILDNVD